MKTQHFLLLPLYALAVAGSPTEHSNDNHTDVLKLQMNDPATAAQKAKSYYDAQTPVTPDECDHYCGVWYGLSSSGFPSAADHWAKTPDSYKLADYEEGALGACGRCRCRCRCRPRRRCCCCRFVLEQVLVKDRPTPARARIICSPCLGPPLRLHYLSYSHSQCVFTCVFMFSSMLQHVCIARRRCLCFLFCLLMPAQRSGPGDQVELGIALLELSKQTRSSPRTTPTRDSSGTPQLETSTRTGRT